MKHAAVIVSCDIISPYGKGKDACWQGICGGRTAITRVDRFDVSPFQSRCAATVDGLRYHDGESLVMQMADRLFIAAPPIPADAVPFLATTKGEIDILEKMLLDGKTGMDAPDPALLLKKIAMRAGVTAQGLTISAACASSASAIARAASMIRNGRIDCALVVACDSVTEFVFAGFSSLMALDAAPARPFDRSRSGLSIGEAAAYVLMMSGDRARRDGWDIVAEVAGWGLSDDANHMTGPSRTSEGMISAIKKAFISAGCTADDIDFISAHGTGTLYNDAMEMRAFCAHFPNGTVPVYSIKGGLGHTMGAAGLADAVIAVKSLEERIVPPTVGLKDADEDGYGWVSSESRPLVRSGRDIMALMTNAGFSGINTALVLSGGHGAN